MELTSGQLSPDLLRFSRLRLQSIIHQLILGEFVRLVRTEGCTVADLARRIGRSEKSTEAYLRAPRNLDLEIISNLLLSMRCELDFWNVGGEVRFGIYRFTDADKSAINAASSATQEPQA